MLELPPDVPLSRESQGNMAASLHSNMDIVASLAGILNEDHCPEHLQVVNTFTTALRDKEYRYGHIF